LLFYIGIISPCSIINLNMKGGENMDKEQLKSFVAGLGIASLVAGVSIAAPAGAAQSG
jgi:radical SAM modification target selenobiotic family peptide